MISETKNKTSVEFKQFNKESLLLTVNCTHTISIDYFLGCISGSPCSMRHLSKLSFVRQVEGPGVARRKKKF